MLTPLRIYEMTSYCEWVTNLCPTNGRPASPAIYVVNVSPGCYQLLWHPLVGIVDVNSVAFGCVFVSSTRRVLCSVLANDVIIIIRLTGSLT